METATPDSGETGGPRGSASMEQELVGTLRCSLHPGWWTLERLPDGCRREAFLPQPLRGSAPRRPALQARTAPAAGSVTPRCRSWSPFLWTAHFASELHLATISHLGILQPDLSPKSSRPALLTLPPTLLHPWYWHNVTE